jgi:hypothetical protein
MLLSNYGNLTIRLSRGVSGSSRGSRRLQSVVMRLGFKFATHYGVVPVTICAGESNVTVPSLVTYEFSACSAASSMQRI